MRKGLRRLIDEQSKDDTYVIEDETRLGNVTLIRQLQVEQDKSYRRISKKDDFDLTLLEGQGAWIGSEHAAYDRGASPCPICVDRKLKWSELCLCCNRSGQDGIRDFTGLPVDWSINEGWQDDKPEPTKYVKDSKLKGGL